MSARVKSNPKELPEPELWKVFVRVDEKGDSDAITVYARRGQHDDWDWCRGTRLIYPKNEKMLHRAIAKCQRVCDARNAVITRTHAMKRYVLTLPQAQTALPSAAPTDQELLESSIGRERETVISPQEMYPETN